MKAKIKTLTSLLLAVSMVLSFCPTISLAEDEVTYLLRDLNAGSSTEVALADYQTYETDHFLVIYDTDGANTISSSQLSTLGTVLERCWALFIDKMGMEPTSTSVHSNGDKTTQYKTNVVVMGTGVDHYYLGAGEWGAYGSVDTAGYPYFMCSVSAITSPTVVAHEFGHAVHYAQGDNAWENNIYLGPWFEAVANWFAEQYIYEYLGSSTTQWSHLYLRAGHLTKMNGRAYYEAWPLLQYLTEDPDNTGVYGSTFVQKLLSYDSGSTSTLFWEVLEANNEDLTVADTVGMYASHMADFDFAKKSRYDTAINNVMNSSLFWTQRYTMLEEKGEESNTYVVPPEKTPQAMGYNIIPLDFTEGEVSVTLNGETSTDGADWRARLVKVSTSGTSTYSDLFSDGETMTISSSSGEELYLTVAATPSLDSMSRHTITGWATHSTETNMPYEKKIQYPYSVTLSGATPMTRPTPSGTFTTHANGGGKVSSSATVASTAYVGPNAVVMGSATVSDNAVIDGYAVVSGSAKISDNAYVGDYAVVFGNAKVAENARVIETACLYGSYKASGNSIIKGSALALSSGTAGGEAVAYGDFFEDAGHTISGGAFSGYHSANDSTYSKNLQSTYVRPYVISLRSRYEFEDNLRDTYTYTDLYGVDVEYSDGCASFDGNNYVILDSSALYFDNSKVTLSLSGTGEALTLGDLSLNVTEDYVAFGSASVTCSNEWKDVEIKLDGSTITLNVNGVEDSFADSTTLLDCAMSGKSYVGKGFDGLIDYVRIYDLGYEYSSTDIGNTNGEFLTDLDTIDDESTGKLTNYTDDKNSIWYGWSSTSSAVTVDSGLNITGAVTDTITSPAIETDKFIIEFTPEGGKAYPDHGILDADGETVLFAHRYATDASAIHIGRGEINSSVRGSDSITDTIGQSRLTNFVGERLASGTIRTDRGALSYANGKSVRIVVENRYWDSTLEEEFAKSENYTDNLSSMVAGDAIYTVTYGTIDTYGLYTPVSVSVYTGSFTGFGGFKIAGGASGVTVSYKNLVIMSDTGENSLILISYSANGEIVKTLSKRSGATFPEFYEYENGSNTIFYAPGETYTESQTVEMELLEHSGKAIGTYFDINSAAYKTVSENLIPNSDFEYGLTGWYNSAGGEASTVYFAVNGDGTVTAKASTNISGAGSLYRAWDVEVGKTYVFTHTSNVENIYHVVSQKDDISATGDGTAIGTSAKGENAFAFTAEKEYVQINFRWLASSNIIGNFGLYEVEDAEADRVVTTINYSADDATIGSLEINGFKGDVIDFTDEAIAPSTITYSGDIYTKDESNPESYTASTTDTVTITYTKSDIQSIETVSVTVIGDNLPILPTTLSATAEGGTTEVSVTNWDLSNLSEGENVVYGTISGTALKAEANVTVLKESFALDDMTSYTSQNSAKTNLTSFPLAITDEFYIEMDVTYSAFGDFWITMFTSSDIGFFSKEQVALGHNSSAGFRPVNGNGSGGRTTSDTNLTTLSANTTYRILVKADASTDKYTVTITSPDGTGYTATDFGFRRSATSIDSIVMFRNDGSSAAATATNIKVYYPDYATAKFVTEDGEIVKTASGDVQEGSFTIEETVSYLIDEDGNGHFYKIPETIVTEDTTVVANEIADMYPVLEDAYVQGTTVYGINATNSNSVFIAAVSGNDRAPLSDADSVALADGTHTPSTLGTSRVGLFQFPVLELEDGKASIAHFYVRTWHSNTFANSNTSIRMAGYAVNDDTWLTGACTAASLTLLDGQTNPIFTSRSTNTTGYITLDITEAMKAAHKRGLSTLTIRLNAAWGAAYVAEREASVTGGTYEGKAAYLTIEEGNYITVSGATKVTKDGSAIADFTTGVTIPTGSYVKMYTDSTTAVAFAGQTKVYKVTDGVTESIVPENDDYAPASIGVEAIDGAQVRIGEGVNSEGKVGDGSGLRFVVQLNRTDSLSSMEDASYGVKITAEGSSADPVDIPAEKWQSHDVFTVALTNLAETNYNRSFTATPYITVDGQTFDGLPVTRSIYKVASGILANGYSEGNNATEADKTGTVYELSKILCDVLNAYVNQTGIRLTITEDGTITARTEGSGAYSGEDLFFDVSRIDNGDGSYTITIIPSRNAEIKSWWKEYIRINNNNSQVVNMITDDLMGEDGTLTFTFTPVTTS